MEAQPFTEPVSPPADNGAGELAEEWLVDSSGKHYLPRQGKRGKLFRQGNETIQEARDRDATPADERRPRRKAKPAMPPRTRDVDLKKLEEVLADALKTPGAFFMAPGIFHDDWAGEHFTTMGPYLARTIINASEYNPWLRTKLEQLSTGEDAMMKVAGLIGIGGGLIMYAVPPAIYFLNLPAEKSRAAFGIPPRREPREPYAPRPSTDQADQASPGGFASPAASA